ncbi:MAG: hypothetical protein QHG98_01125 [Methanothrix sp.]|uniref:hypothetical protein n=1 Tax=Methanothrix sp. TaxID=90426 RepID=UPI00247CF867|nr:hypothetical protein [Methanothrix sp.]
MAVQLGIQNLGGTKAQLAESIIEARRKAQPPIAEIRTAEVQLKPEERKDVPAKAAEVEPALSAEIPLTIQGKGVRARQEAMRRKSAELRSAGVAIRDEGVSRMAKSVNALKKSIEEQTTENKKGIAKIRTGVRQMKLAIGKTSEEMRKAGERIREEGAKELNEGLRSFRADLDNQIRENRDAVSRMGSGAAEIRSAMDKMSVDFRKSGERIREEGARELNDGMRKFRADVENQIRENHDAISRMNTAARELHSRALALRDDMQRYVEQDVNRYIRDFYYG